ncbi:MAG: hypothetical protein NZM35_02210 [Chitinophagales bacterium]|nr:hypothetical protein [Chitinophagales bacterium]MDW8418285.1 hypothetical protein [Chitinophagales bacterium]
MDNRPHTGITEELTTIAPLLARIPYRQPVSAPEGYFALFTSRMATRVAVVDRQMLPEAALQTLHQRLVAEVPAGYFDAFTRRMLSEVAAPQRTEIFPAWLRNIDEKLQAGLALIFRPRLVWAYSLASTLVLVGLLWFASPDGAACPQGDLLCQLQQIDEREIDLYMRNHADEFSEDAAGSAYNVDDLPAALTAGDIWLNDFTDEELEYLSE